MRAESRRLLSVLTVALALGSCTGPGDAPFIVGDPESGGTAVVSVTSDFQAFNPVTNSALVTMEVINFMLFTPLIQFDQDLDAAPALAERWDLDEQGVTFHLRSDVRWHDGQPVTAEDVRFAFDLAKNPETASLLASAYLTMVETAEVIDPQTIRFTFGAPHAQPLQAFWWAPLPRHLLEGTAPSQVAQAPFNRSPVGNGPFRFVSWDPGQRLVLEANPDYPEELGGRPYLDRIVFRVVPEATTRLTEILTGAIDVNYTLHPDETLQIEGQRGVQLVGFSGREFLYLGWNNEREPFRDPRVRRALGMAVDRGTLIEALMHGHAEPAAGMIPSWSPVAPGVEPLAHDPAAARQLLQEAGFIAGADGIMRRGGQPLRFTLLSSEDRMRQDISVVLQQQLRAVGADVQVRAIEFQTLLQQHRNRDYDAIVSGWTLDNFRVDPTPLFSCEEAGNPGSPNRAGYCNPDADRLMAAGLLETDDARAQEIWGEFSRLLQADQPITFLVWQEQMAAIRERVQGVEMDVRGKLLSAPHWWIPEGQRR